MSDARKSFQERLSSFAENERKKAQFLPPGPAKDLALQKVSQAETAAYLDQLAKTNSALR